MSTIGKLIPDDDQAQGYCSSSKVRPLTSKQISRVMDAVNGSEVTGLTVFSEKTLIGKGTRKLCSLQEGDNKVTLVEYAGVRKAKFVSADAKRYEVNNYVSFVSVDVIDIYLLYTSYVIHNSDMICFDCGIAFTFYILPTSSMIYLCRPWSREQSTS